MLSNTGYSAYEYHIVITNQMEFGSYLRWVQTSDFGEYVEKSQCNLYKDLPRFAHITEAGNICANIFDFFYYKIDCDFSANSHKNRQLKVLGYKICIYFLLIDHSSWNLEMSIYQICIGIANVVEFHIAESDSESDKTFKQSIANQQILDESYKLNKIFLLALELIIILALNKPSLCRELVAVSSYRRQLLSDKQALEYSHSRSNP